MAVNLDTCAETVGWQVAAEVMGYRRSKFFSLLRLNLLPVKPQQQPGDPKWSRRKLIAYLEGRRSA